MTSLNGKRLLRVIRNSTRKNELIIESTISVHLGLPQMNSQGGWEETRYFNKVVVILKYALKGNFKDREGLLTGWAGK